LTNLGQEGSRDLGREFNVMDPAGGLVSLFP
jgi:hypothetical protein